MGQSVLVQSLSSTHPPSNMYKAILFSALVALAVADNAPSYKPAPAYKEPSYDEPAKDAYATSGSYSVHLPDGRIQTVTYTVSDAYSGYVADVKYSGEAKYDDAHAYKPAHKPAPAYKHA